MLNRLGPRLPRLNRLPCPTRKRRGIVLQCVVMLAAMMVVADDDGDRNMRVLQVQLAAGISRLGVSMARLPLCAWLNN